MSKFKQKKSKFSFRNIPNIYFYFKILHINTSSTHFCRTKIRQINFYNAYNAYNAIIPNNTQTIKTYNAIKFYFQCNVLVQNKKI